MCQTKQIWSNACQYSQRFEIFSIYQREPNRHTRDDPVHGTSDILGMAFLSPALSS